ncbi:MAG TPA: hypothetical protein VLB47_00995, partial [Solirubrobacteraceae bacterium]|nr:hypothetical protein [Solirubrobacteraceae bacterium]
MATVEELDRLTALLARLTPLAAQQPGELVRAADWNTVVGTLIEVVGTLVHDQDQPVKPHDHPDQVAVGWLDPRLRQLVEQGPLGDPAAVARVDALERADTRIGALVEQLRGEVEQLRGRALDIATKDVERAASLSVVRRKVEGLDDAREDVLAVRASLDSVRAKVDRAVELAEVLQHDGEPVDVAALKARVDALDAFRAKLTLPDGEELDGAAFERRLAELRDELVTQEVLDEALKSQKAELDPVAEQALEDRLKTHLDAEVGGREEALKAELAATTDARLAGVDAKVNQGVADALPGLTASVLGQARADLDARAGELLGQAATAADERIKAAGAELTEQLGARIEQARAEVPATVDARIDARLTDAVAELRDAIGGMRADLDGVAGRLDRAVADTRALDARITEVQRAQDARLDQVAGELKSTLADLQRSTDTRLDGLEGRVAGLDERVTKLDAT